MLKPLSRRVRGKTGAAEQITPRDIEICKFLYRHKYARANFLATYFNSPLRAFSKRLLKLDRAGYVKRPPQQWDYFNSNYRFIIYELDAKGKKLLDEMGYEATPVATFKHLMTEFAHNLGVSDVSTQIELGARTFNTIPVFIPNVSIPSNIQGQPYSPDLVFKLPYDQPLYVALEIDCGTEPLRRENLKQSSILKKALQIKDVLATNSYRTYFPSFWYGVVTNSTERMENIRQLFAEQNLPFGIFATHPILGDYHVRDGKYVSSEPTPDGALFLKPWTRTNGKDFTF